MSGQSSLLRLLFLNVLMSSLMLALGSGEPSHASYTGLVAIPTADVVPAGEYGIKFQFDGSFADFETDTHLINTEIGLTPRLEAGVDFDLHGHSGSHVLMNAKYVLLQAKKSVPALAIGITNFGPNTKHSPYLVATRDFRELRGHGGVMRIDGRNRWFIGVERAISKKVTAMADFTSGFVNFTTIGLNYQISDRFGILAGVQFPNLHDEDKRFTIHLATGGSYRTMREETD